MSRSSSKTVFAWPGIGRLLYEGITFRDFPVVQGVVIMGGAMIVMRQPGGRHSLRGNRSRVSDWGAD